MPEPTLWTPLCDMLGIRFPVLQAGMVPGGSPELAAAVSNAGGLGVLGASGWEPETFAKRFAGYGTTPITHSASIYSFPCPWPM